MAKSQIQVQIKINSILIYFLFAQIKAAPLKNAHGDIIIDKDRYTARTDIHFKTPRKVLITSLKILKFQNADLTSFP